MFIHSFNRIGCDKIIFKFKVDWLLALAPMHCHATDFHQLNVAITATFFLELGSNR